MIKVDKSRIVTGFHWLGIVVAIPLLLVVAFERHETRERVATERVLLSQINIKHFERRIFEDLVLKRRNDLSGAGPVFEYDFTSHAWGYQRHGCLIGGEGKVYTYDSETSLAPALLTTINPTDYARARGLAASIGQGAEPELDLNPIMHDAGESIWSVVTNGRVIALKEIGNFARDLSDPRAVELVRLISRWCPAAAGADVLR